MTKRFVLPALLLAAALPLTACTAEEPPPGAGTASPAPASPGAEDRYDTADVTFARGMLPHHEQAVTMSDLVLAKDGLDRRVAELATQIKEAQAPEIERLTGWLAEWGADPSASGSHDGGDGGDGGHDGHEGMSGMMSEEDLADLSAADGADAGRLFLTQMIEHHEGAVAMARAELDEGEHAGAREMARAIVDSQSAEIAHMRELLGDG